MTGDGGALGREKKNNHKDSNLLRTWIDSTQDLLDITSALIQSGTDGELNVQSSGSGPVVEEGAGSTDQGTWWHRCRTCSVRPGILKGAGSRKLAAAARARIAAAQKARWAKVRKNAGDQNKVVPIPGKRTLSASARRKISAAQRARWAYSAQLLILRGVQRRYSGNQPIPQSQSR